MPGDLSHRFSRHVVNVKRGSCLSKKVTECQSSREKCQGIGEITNLANKMGTMVSCALHEYDFAVRVT